MLPARVTIADGMEITQNQQSRTNQGTKAFQKVDRNTLIPSEELTTIPTAPSAEARANSDNRGSANLFFLKKNSIPG